jgi:hypothetical protein
MRLSRSRRAGLTLLEMVLTCAIGMVLLSAVFMIMRSQYGHAQAGREAIEEASIARNILTKVSADIVNSLGPVDPRFLPQKVIPTNANVGVPKIKNVSGPNNSNNGSGQSSNNSSSNSSSNSPNSNSGANNANSNSSSKNGNSNSSSKNGNSNSSSNNNNSNSSSNNDSSSSSGGTTTTPVPYNLGVKGDSTWVVLSTSGVPGALITSPKTVVTTDNTPSDLRSVSIWLVEGKGLARKELTGVTSDDAPTGEPNFSDANERVIAPQVKSVQFQYFDGQEWQDTWDGTQLGGADGNTPIGPPLAIAITITLRSTTPGEGEEPARKYKHVIALPATNGFTMANQGGQGNTASGQSLGQALQTGQQLPTTSITNLPQSTQGGQSSSSNNQGQ